MVHSLIVRPVIVILRSILITVCLMGGAIASGPLPADPVIFDINKQPLRLALTEFARQSDRELLFSTEVVENKVANHVDGTYEPEDALELLLVDTGLEYSVTVNDTILVAEGDGGPDSRNSRARPILLAQNQTPAEQKRSATERENDEEDSLELEKIVVTGTNIKGVNNIASPISIYTQADIERSGAGSIQRFIQTLPENFKGGASEGTIGSVAGGAEATNTVGGTGVNLRGLGNDSTLVLLNGRRLAPGNSRGNFVDVSMLPTSAIERVEVMPDGASALYGADAVGGVVNFIMRKDYEGAELRARYGAVSEGSLKESQVAGTGGLVWEGGSALASFEYFDQKALELNGKSWVWNPTARPFDVLPEQNRFGVFASFTQSLGSRLELFADANYANRKMPNNKTSPPFTEGNSRVDIDAYSVTAGARAQIAEAHELEFAASYGASETDRDFLNIPADVLLVHGKTNTDVLTFEGRITGAQFALPGGTAAYAAGLHYRKESFRDFNLLTNALTFERDRKIWAGFAELRLPLAARRGGEALLDLTLAGRYEDYNDFGGTFNPKIGLIFTPSDDIRLRGTWGTSFKAPLLLDLNPIHSQVAVGNFVFDPTVNSNVITATVFGGNPDLAAEEAESWTVGMDWTPQSIPSLKGRLTYYDISYTDRITTPQNAFRGIIPNFNTDWLEFENLLAQFITRNPSLGQIQALVANTNLFSDFTGIPGGVDLADIVALNDARSINLSSDKTSGLDFGLSYQWDLGGPSIETGVDGTYILKLDRTPAPGTPVIHAVDTVFNPADLKLRARAIFQNGGFSAALFANYVDSYTDTRGGANISVASWTTLDLNLDYQFDDAGPLRGLSFNIGAVNLTDAPPPFVASSLSARPGFDFIVFDGANADVRGRFIYGQVTKRF